MTRWGWRRAVLGAAALVPAVLAGGCPESPSDAEGDDPLECRDGADNDGDGDFDCRDDGCAGSPDCEAAGDDDDAGDDPVPFALDVDRMLDDIAWLADDERAGRLPGTPGNDAAIGYVADRFADLGLVPAGDDGDWFRRFAFTRWESTAEPTLALDGDAWPAGSFELFRGSGGGDVTAEVVFVGYGLTVPPFDPADHPGCPLPPEGFDEYAGVDVTGKLVLVLRHGPNGDEGLYRDCPSSGDPTDGSPPGSTEVLWRFTYKMWRAVEAGAAGMLLVPGYDQASDESFGGALRDAAWQPTFPSLYLDRDRLEQALPDLRAWADGIDATGAPGSRATGLTAAVSASTEQREQEAFDVVGAVPGVDPERAGEAILLGAHIDHLGLDGDGAVFHGADDNASGTSVLMELARGMATRAEPAARPVVFVAFNAEELGLVGSCDYAADPSVAWPLADLSAMISIDMVGGGDGSGLDVHGGSEGPGRTILTRMRDRRDAAGLDLDVNALEPSGRSDHACFAAGGVPAVLASTAGEHPNYHQTSDRSDAIQGDDVLAAATLLWGWLEDAADAD